MRSDFPEIQEDSLKNINDWLTLSTLNCKNMVLCDIRRFNFLLYVFSRMAIFFTNTSLTLPQYLEFSVTFAWLFLNFLFSLIFTSLHVCRNPTKEEVDKQISSRLEEKTIMGSPEETVEKKICFIYDGKKKSFFVPSITYSIIFRLNFVVSLHSQRQ